MKKLILFHLILICTISCDSQQIKDQLEPSYKAQKGNKPEITEYFNKESNIYSNYTYNIAIQSPKNWRHDNGVSEHTVFRAFVMDSGYSYSLNVFESINDIENSFWIDYNKNISNINKQFSSGMEKMLNTKISIEYTKIAVIKNFKSIKRKYTYTVIDNEFVFDMTSIVHQIPKGKFLYTITLTIPKFFYDESSGYFDNILNGIYWLPNKKQMIDEIKNSK